MLTALWQMDPTTCITCGNRIHMGPDEHTLLLVLLEEQWCREKLPTPAKLTPMVSAVRGRTATDLAVFSCLVALGKWLHTLGSEVSPLSVIQHRNFQPEAQQEWKGCRSHNKPNNHKFCHQKALRVQMHSHLSFVAESP